MEEENKTIIYWKYLWKTIQLLISIAILYGLYYSFCVKQDIFDLWRELRSNGLEYKLFPLLVALTLVIPNCLLEAQKWHCLMLSFEKISFSTSLKAVLSGSTLALITPARLGDYVGRSWLLDKKRLGEGLTSTLLCSWAQVIATLIFGIIGFVVFESVVNLIGNDTLLGIWAVTLCFFLLAGFVGIHHIFRYLEYLPGIRKYIYRIKIGTISKYKLLLVFALAILRYLVYALQYMLVLYALTSNLALFSFFDEVARIFLFKTLLPLPAILGFVARTEIAVLVLAALNINSLLIVLSSVIVWLINQVFPAVLGWMILLKKKTIYSDT